MFPVCFMACTPESPNKRDQSRRNPGRIPPDRSWAVNSCTGGEDDAGPLADAKNRCEGFAPRVHTKRVIFKRAVLASVPGRRPLELQSASKHGTPPYGDLDSSPGEAKYTGRSFSTEPLEWTEGTCWVLAPQGQWHSMEMNPAQQPPYSTGGPTGQLHDALAARVSPMETHGRACRLL